MGMMLRRRKRKPDYLPQVNGKPIVSEQKVKKLTKDTMPVVPTYGVTKK